MNTKMRERYYSDAGYSLVAFIILLALSAIVVAGSQKLQSADSRTIATSALRSTHYYQSESGVGTAVSWLRDESQNIVSPFSRENFYSVFTQGAPSVGDNDNSMFSIPTKIKSIGTNDSILLTSDSSLGVSNFPASQNLASGAAFDAVADFAATSFADALVRVTLVDARPIDPGKDYGPPPNPAPETDFYPIYRIDAMTNLDQGSHVYGYVMGSLFYVDTVGFYGRDFVDVRQDCKSYPFTNANVNVSALNAHCPVGSNGWVAMQNNAEVYGSVRTNGSITNNPDHVCADLTPGCPNKGKKCEGSECSVPGLPTYESWETHCAGGNLGNVVVPSNGAVVLTAGTNPNQHCWDSVTINNKGKLTLQTTTNPYWIRTLNISGGNPQTQLRVVPSPASGTVRLFLKTVVGDSLNGNQAVNPTSRPSQFRLYYLGSNDLTINGNSSVGMALVAPNAGVTVSGSADFNGGIMATHLTLTGSANVYYDETLGGEFLNNSNYKLRDLVQYYK